MKSKQISFDAIETAITKLGRPDAIWFRGHVAEHRLIPTLFRFPHGAKKEPQIFKLYKEHSYLIDKKILDDHTVLFAMHQNYFPTRLISWTESLHVAIFCALVRESPNPTLFILDPVALNRYSKLTGIMKLETFTRKENDCMRLSNLSTLSEYPIAIEGDFTDDKEISTEEIFTLHGTNELSLEELCPNCVIKLVLTEEEKSFAREGILSGRWLP